MRVWVRECGYAGTGKKNCEYELSTHTRVLPALSVLVPALAIVIPLPAIYWVSTRAHIETKSVKKFKSKKFSKKQQSCRIGWDWLTATKSRLLQALRIVFEL